MAYPLDRTPPLQGKGDAFAGATPPSALPLVQTGSLRRLTLPLARPRSLSGRIEAPLWRP